MTSTTNTTKSVAQFNVVRDHASGKRYKLNLVTKERDEAPKRVDPDPLEEVSVCTELVRDRMERRRCFNCTLSVSELWFFRPIGRFPLDRICVHKCVSCGAGRSQCTNCS